MTRKRLIVIGVGVLAIVAGFLWAFRDPPIPVEVARVTRGAFEQSVEEDGKTRVRERYVVSAPLAGRLERILLKAGDPVREGMLLARLQPSVPNLLDARTVRELEERVGAAEAAQAQARAEVARAQAALTQARNDARRAQNLSESGFVSSSAREQAELTVRVQTKALEAARFAQHGAQHNLDQARAALIRVREVPPAAGKLGSWQILSPVGGRVLRVLQESEAAVGVGSPLLEIADSNDLEVVVDVLSTDATRIPAQARVHLDAGAGYNLEGRVRLIEPAAFTKVSALGVEEQRVNAIIDFTSPREAWQALGDAFRVDARIVTLARDNVLRVPISALFRDNAHWAVFVVAQGKARKQTVGVTARTPAMAMVENGLEEGATVIVYPSDSVATGKRVQVVRGE